MSDPLRPDEMVMISVSDLADMLTKNAREAREKLYDELRSYADSRPDHPFDPCCAAAPRCSRCGQLPSAHGEEES